MTAYGIMYDTDGHLPFLPRLQAFYFNGRAAHRPVTFGRGRVWIDVTGAAPWDCHWADVETGDIAPEHFPGWNHARHQATADWGGFYCNRATLPKVLEHLGSAPADLWLATLDGTSDPADIPELAQLPATVRLVAVQAYPAAMTGGHWDESVIVSQDYWERHHA
jgi:hypothetical protein